MKDESTAILLPPRSTLTLLEQYPPTGPLIRMWVTQARTYWYIESPEGVTLFRNERSALEQFGVRVGEMVLEADRA